MFNTARFWNCLGLLPQITWASVVLTSASLWFSTPQAIATEVQPTHPTVEIQAADQTIDAIALEVQTTDLTTEIQSTDTIASDAQELTPTSEGELNSAIAEPNNLEPASLQPKPTASANPAMTQVTSVSQLSDVQPTDWAFQALQSLVERYGAIAGYPDGTFRGNRAMTRYEFAAGLNTALDRINELIGAGTSELVRQEDLETVQKLQAEFAAELATLRGRVDTLEVRTSELEANQFSTTTKLSGLVWFNATGAFAGDGVKVETNDLAGALGRIELRQAVRDPLSGRPMVREVSDDPAVTFSNLGWLSFNTSFTGKDQLVTQLAFGNGESPANVFGSTGSFDTYGTPYVDQTAGFQEENNGVVLRELFYSFPVNDSIQLVVGPRVNWYRYFDNNRFTFFLNSNYSFNSVNSPLLNTLDRGAGVASLIKLSDQLQLNLAYLGETTEYLPRGLFNSSTDPRRGLFGGTWTATAELTYSPSDTFSLRLLYNRSRLEARNGQIGGALGEPLQNGIADAGPGFSTIVDAAGFVTNGGLTDSTADTFSINFDWLITEGLGIFGRYSYGITHLRPINEDINVQSFQLGLGLPDLGKPGAFGSLSVLVPFDVQKGEEFLVSGYGDGGTQIDIEASYFFPITNNIAIAPAFYAILNPNNFGDNPTVFVGSMSTQFRF